MENINEIMQMVHSFYSDAFSQLITITIAILVFAGGLIPIAITLYQNKQFKHEQKQIKQFISNEIENTKKQLMESIKEKIDIEIKDLKDFSQELESKIDTKFEVAEAGVLHIQGNQLTESKEYPDALDSYLDAAMGYLQGKDEQNLQRVLESITEYCFPFITKENHKTEPSIVEKTQALIEAMDKYDQNGRYTDVTADLRLLLNDSKSRSSNDE